VRDSAFPSHVAAEEAFDSMDARNQVSGGGLTKREYFAAAALTGLLADPLVVDIHEAAMSAVHAADFLIAALAASPAGEGEGK
jgi:hypothetical protein